MPHLKKMFMDEVKKIDYEQTIRVVALTVEAPRFGKGKGSGAKEDSSPASSLTIL